MPANAPRAVHRQRHGSGLILAEHDVAKHRRRGVVQMHDSPRRPLQRLEGTIDQIVARLRQHLNRDVMRDQLLVDQGTHKIEIRLRRRRESHLNLFETALQQQLIEFALARVIHRLRQRLVAVAQIAGAPARRLPQRARRPLAIR